MTKQHVTSRWFVTYEIRTLSIAQRRQHEGDPPYGWSEWHPLEILLQTMNPVEWLHGTRGGMLNIKIEGAPSSIPGSEIRIISAFQVEDASFKDGDVLKELLR